MPRQPSRVSPERDARLRMWQNIAITLMTLGVAVLVYLAVAHTA